MNNIVFIDSRVAGYQTLIDGLKPGTEWFLIDGQSAGIDQISTFLRGRTGIDALHIFSHGGEGSLFLGNSVLNVNNLGDFRGQLREMGACLNESADILLYGCDVAAGDRGLQFIRALAETTGADVAASNDATGWTELGGNWALESTTGSIDVSIPLDAASQANFHGTLSWYDTLSNDALKNLIIQDLTDNVFSYQEVLTLLNTASLSGVSSSEFSDLTTFSQNATNLYANDYLRYITSAVINGNPANQYWWGGCASNSQKITIGNLSGGSSEYVAKQLIDEWFLGRDLPVPSNGESIYQYSDASGSLFVNGLSASDINQGALGDCYLLASLGSIADNQSQFISDAFTDNGNGTYGVRFYYNGQPIYTTVNNRLPTSGSSLVFAGNAAGSLSGETWVSLFEKAYVQVNAQYNFTTEQDRSNNYQVIEGGWAYPITEITNLSYHYYSSYYSGTGDPMASGFNVSANPSSYKNAIISALDQGAIVWLGSFGNTSDSTGKRMFVSSHAFMVLGYNESTDTFTIRNPWGAGGSTYLPEFQAHIEDFWNSNVKAVVAVSDLPANNVAPTLVHLLPQDNASNVAPSANLVLEFSESVKSGAGNILIYNNDGTLAKTISVTDTSQVTFSGNTVTINPTTNLAASSSYYVNIGPGVIQDMSGSSFAGISGSTAYNFSTSSVDTIAPVLSTLSPVDNATGVPVGSNLVLTFSEAMAVGSGNILIYNSNGSLARSIPVSDSSQVTISGSTVIINPSTDLSANSSYYINIGSGVLRDLAGNAFTGIGDSTSYNFTTASSGTDDYADSVTDTTAPMGNLVVGSSTTGNIETAGDHDLFRINLTAGTAVVFQLKGASSGEGSLSDCYLRIRDSAGNVLVYDDDSGIGTDSQLTFTPIASGDYYIDAAHYSTSGIGTYRVSATRLADTTAPTLSSLSPADNATGVAVNSNIVLTFSEAMAVGTGNILIYNGNGTLARTISITDTSQVTVSGNTVTINPTTDLSPSSSYYINIGAGVLQDLSSNAFAGISGASTYNFTTATSGSDDYADNVTDTTAPMGNLLVGGSSTGTIESAGDHDLFRVNLVAGTAYTFELKGASSGSGTLSDCYLRIRDSAGTQLAQDDDSGIGTDSLLTFTPTVSGSYYIDAAHYSLSGIGTYRVSASLPADSTAPTLTSLSPADNATSVAVDSNIVLTFSEAMAVGTGNILIYNSNATLARTISITDTSQVTVSGNTVTINPTTDLSTSSSYYINIGAGVLRDLAGNAFAGISGASTYNFTTATSGSDDYADNVTDSTAPMGNLLVGGSSTGTIESAGDHDLFRVNLTAGTTYTIELKGAGSGAGTLSDSYLRIRNSSGTQLAQDDDSGAGLDSLLTYTPSSSGTYYIDAAHYSESTSGLFSITGTYAVTIRTPIDTTAPILNRLSPTDNATEVAVDSNIVLTFNEGIRAGNGNIYIYRNDGTLAKTISVNDATQVSFSENTVLINPSTNLSESTGYYVNISNGAITDVFGNAFAGISGATTYNFTTRSHDDYADSVTDTTAPMGDLTVGSSASGTIETAGDHDLFRVNLIAGTAYTFELKGVGSGAGTLSDSYLRIRNSAGSLLASDDDSGPGSDSLLNFTPTVSGNYYLDAAHYSSTGIGTYQASLRVADITAPTLSGLSPADNATGVPVNSNIVLTFSEAMAVGYGNILIYNSNGTVARMISITDTSQVSVSGNIVTINPTTDLSANTSYYINIASGLLRDLAGNAFAGISGTSAYNFATLTNSSDDYADSVTDTTAPMGNLVVGGRVTGNIETAGDHDLFRVNLLAGTSYSIELKGADSGAGTLSDCYLKILDSAGSLLAYDDDSGIGFDSLLTFTPTTSGNYYIDAAHYSSAGIGTYQVNLRQVDITAPTLSSLSPADNAIGVAVNSNIVLTFSEAIAANSGNILIYYGDGSLAQLISVTDSSQVTIVGNTVTINPTIDLSPASNYYINIGSGVLKDLAGNSFAGINGTTAYNFTTIDIDDYADSVTDTTTAIGSLSVGSNVSGNIETPGDHDLFRVNLLSGSTYTIELRGEGSGAGTLSDCYLRIRNSSGTELAYDDDGGINFDSLLTFTPTSSGNYYIDAAHYHSFGTGTYRVYVTGNSGGSGNDTLIGSDSDDTLSGGDGTDVLDGGRGADLLNGGAGNDYYFVDNVGDRVVETISGATGGIDVVYCALPSYALTANVEIGRILATGAANLTGNELANVIFAGLGDNFLDGGTGNDTVSWQYGVSGGMGVTASLTTGLAIGSGSDRLINTENLTGSANADSLTGDGNANTLDGAAGNDNLNGASGNDALFGGDGVDVLDGGSGADLLNGGDGSDYYFVNDIGDLVVENNAGAAGGNDVVYTSLAAYALTANVETGRIVASGAANLNGNELVNVLYAGLGNNVLDGSSGADTVSWQYGVSGSAGVTASLTSGFASGSGSDMLLGIENLTGTANADSLTGDGNANALDGATGNDNLNGAGGNDTLLGGDGNDVLDGGSGADSMNGGAGNDYYFVDNSGDLVIETGIGTAGGNDVVYSTLAAYTLSANVETGRLLATGAANLTGNDLANVLFAGIGSNILDGSTGTDTVSWQYGVSGGAGVTASLASGLASGSGNDTLIGIEHLIGSANADSLTGDGNANMLDGAAGNDTLNGGLGNDWLIGGSGSDNFVFTTLPNVSSNVDRIVDFSVVDDTIVLDDAVFTSLLAGPLAAGAFRAAAGATSAADADDYLIYNTTTGALYYDAAGNTGESPLQIALLGSNLALTSADFFVS